MFAIHSNLAELKSYHTQTQTSISLNLLVQASIYKDNDNSPTTTEYKFFNSLKDLFFFLPKLEYNRTT